MRALCIIGVVLAFLVVVLGAYVRLSDAGLGCPDWPGCYGRLLAPAAEHELAAANADFPHRPVQVGKAWREMVHRYAAGILGLLILAIAVSAWRTRRERGTTVILPTALVGLVILQAILGMLTVTWLLKPLIVVSHLLGGLAILALLWWLALGGGRDASLLANRETTARSVSRLAAIAIAVLLLQIALGGWTSSNYAALACTDFPRCHGQWWPAMSWREGFTLWRGLGTNYEYGVLDSPARTAIHMAHRFGALAAFVIVAAAAVRALRADDRGAQRTAMAVLLLLVLQVSLGIANVRLGLPLYTAVAHTAGAALLLLGLTTLLYRSRRIVRGPEDTGRVTLTCAH